MKYVFEAGNYPDQVELGVYELPNDDAAISYARAIGADYVWDMPDDANPGTVWRRPTCSHVSENNK